MYSKIKSCVKGCNSVSEYFECAVGLRQGEVISPVLFALFIEDIELILQNEASSGLTIDDITFILLLFADDMAILGSSPDDLQNSLNLLNTYCNTWGLEVNVQKTKIMVFRNRGPVLRNEKWSYNDSDVELVDNFNYLGTVFNYTGTFVLNQETLAGKGLKALNTLLYNTKGLNLKTSVKLQLFDAFVGSTLNFGCEVWGFGKSKELERVHLRFCKSTLNVKLSTSNMGVYGELGRYPLYVNRLARIVKYWCKIIESDNILIVKLYNSLLHTGKTARLNWVLICIERS